jgi:protein-S-isoprenylcysteine O-methyltransferase Ste14
MVLVSANWMLLLFMIIGVPFTYWRLSKEEAMLIEQFGNQYREYIKRTGRLFPKLRQTSSSD